MKRLLIMLFGAIVICGGTLQAQGIRSFIGTYYGFTLYEDNTITSYCPSYYKQQMDGNEYHKSHDGRYAYRQDGDKIYCYTIAEGKEVLVMDFGLKTGDIFALYDGLSVIVEEVSDTLLPYSRNQQISCKKILLRGVEQPDFTDTWIEDIGSLRYGLNPPKAGDTRLIYACRYIWDYLLDKYECHFDFHAENVHGLYVALGKSIDESAFNSDKEYQDACENKLLTFDLRNDTLCIEGYIAAWCDRKPYLLIKEDLQDIFVTSTKYYVGYQQDCTSVYPIDLKIPGFTQDEYIVHYDGCFYQIPQNGLFTLEPIDIDGKEWNIETRVAGGAEEDYIDGRYTRDVHMWIDGDTIVDNIVCKRLYKHTKELWSEGKETLEVGYCRQDGEKYYQNGELMFDFSLQVGDVFVPEKGEPLTIKFIGDTILTDGINRKYLLMVEDMNAEVTPYNSDYWVEGLGSLRMGIYTNDFSSAGLVKTLQSCSYGEKIIYSKEILPFVDKCRGFMLYEGGKCSYYTLYGNCTIEGVDYINEDNGRYCYRQDGNRVYCYSLAEQKEYLVMDFGLKVGDVFTLYDGCNVVVEQLSDTLLSCWNSQKTYKKFHLRGVEQLDFTDVWIEGIGSLRYGINPPRAEESHLLHSSMSMEECEEYCDYCTFVFEFQKDDLRATRVMFGEEIYEDAFLDYSEYEEAHNNKFMTFGLNNDTLHIGGYIGTYCEQTQFFLIEEGAGTIHITSVPFPLDPEADCRSVNSIDVKFPGFTQEEYIVYYKDRVMTVSQTDKPYLISDGLQWAKCCYYYTGDYTTVAYELHGDTIIDGKSYKKEWSTHWEDLSHMELTGYFMREEAGKVYRKEGHSDEYLWFDYEANIGDTIFYGNSFVKVIGYSDTTIVCNGVSHTYRGVDVQVGTKTGSDTDGEYSLISGYIETFYEYLGLFTNGDVVRDPSFWETGGQIELLWLKRDYTMLYQQEEGVFWKDNTSIEAVKVNNHDIPYYDLQGRKVIIPTCGVYIKGGKKIIVK